METIDKYLVDILSKNWGLSASVFNENVLLALKIGLLLGFMGMSLILYAAIKSLIETYTEKRSK